ncbi:hypothetical protein LC1Hm_2109 [Halomicrobium sp. LC1Hm]|nr:hypothetical protein LC1Hm_2109 [Halomicrobium sp. LC1Hm]
MQRCQDHHYNERDDDDDVDAGTVLTERRIPGGLIRIIVDLSRIDRTPSCGRPGKRLQ